MSSEAEKYDFAGESDSLSMVDVLAEEARLQEDASAVLGDSDENNCTYSKGYVQRQALYACSTCSPVEPAGICLACSYHCHEGHELFELYTKRFFRCDCGNSKFAENKCKLTPTKDPVNEDNHYNQNFQGLYCNCHRPYPDSEDEIEDEMIQCVVCEDWYHSRHLNSSMPDNQDFQEMICTHCMDRHNFLWAYYIHSQAITVKCEEEEQTDISINEGGEEQKVSLNGGMSISGETCNGDIGVSVEIGTGNAVISNNASGEDASTTVETFSRNAVKSLGTCNGEITMAGKTGIGDREMTGETSIGYETKSKSCNEQDTYFQPPAKRLKVDIACDSEPNLENDLAITKACFLQELKEREITSRHCGTYWPDDWRAKLCKCSLCKKMYEEEGVSFLLDTSDTVHAYEERGRNKPSVSETDIEHNVLSQMNRVQQVEILHGFNDLKTELREFLRGFAATGTVVGAEDIRAFFSRMEARKRERNMFPQYHCK